MAGFLTKKKGGWVGGGGDLPGGSDAKPGVDR
jgi:hypothetical protein